MTHAGADRAVRRPAAALLAAVALCACSVPGSGSGGPPPAAAPPSSVPTTVPTTVPSTSPPLLDPRTLGPLTGLPVSPEVARAPVVAVPVTTGTGRPAPTGLDEADLTYVAFPGPARQRVVALFHSRPPERVGPVAQTRPMDGKLVRLYDAVLQYGGGPASFVQQLERTEVTPWSSLTQSSGFTREPSGLLYAAPAVARGADGARATTTGVLPFARTPVDEDPSPPEVDVQVPAQPALALRYDPDDRRWSGRLGELEVSATNVVLQEVAYEQLVLPKTGGATERDPVLLSADGDATVLRPSGAVTATWNRRGIATATSFVADDGVPVRLEPGTTSVLLVPEGTQVDGVEDP